MKQKVLVVDDSLFIRSSLIQTLESEGYEMVGSVPTGEEALEIVEQLRPQLVILDMVLPDMTGIDVLKVVKKHYPETKVVILSTMAQQSVIVEAKAAGADRYLIKPVSENDLIEALNEIFTAGKH